MSKRVLIVDDEPHIVTMISSRLKANGYEVSTASNGKEALQIVEKELPDAIILDVMLPEINGHEVCSKLKAEEKYKDIPVIILSACAEVPDMQTGLDKGADAYVTKPFEAERLLAVLNGLLQS
jgi:DNA-binding response OmpR family regulator